ncbi:MAG: aldo/keto reductase [Hyphomicrobiaceae bacterium]|nr:aldo/keto reductase [Hyphomicrobiaceae bacterium]
MNRKDWTDQGPTRRAVLGGMAATGALTVAGLLPPGPRTAVAAPSLMRAIPSTGQKIPAIGMGTWITFNVGPSRKLREARLKVLQTFFDMGGGMIDSSPMYGTSEDVVGYCLSRIENDQTLFSATKVWTVSEAMGKRQMKTSAELWGLKTFDLMQIHNLLDWETHLRTLKSWKERGRIRHIGITTSHGRRHDDLLDVMRSQPVDFVQFTYNILDREAENRLLPTAADRGLAVIINRPFRRGDLFSKFDRHPLPQWAGEIGCTNWASFLLKFVISHPAVTCAIPATSRVDHMRENMATLKGPLPDAAMRRRMVGYVESL